MRYVVLNMPLQVWFVIHRLGPAVITHPTKFEP